MKKPNIIRFESLELYSPGRRVLRQRRKYLTWRSLRRVGVSAMVGRGKEMAGKLIVVYYVEVVMLWVSGKKVDELVCRLSGINGP